MKISFSLALNCLIVLGLCGCSVNISQPAMSIPFSEVTSTPPAGNIPDNATPANGTTAIPITWAGLNLTGRLVYITASFVDTLASRVQMLNLATGEIKTIFTTTTGDWIYYVTISPDAKQLILSYIPPSQTGSLSGPALGKSGPQPFNGGTLSCLCTCIQGGFLVCLQEFTSCIG